MPPYSVAVILASLHAVIDRVDAFFSDNNGCDAGTSAGGLSTFPTANWVPFENCGVHFSIDGEKIDSSGSIAVLDTGGDYEFAIVADYETFVGGLIRVEQDTSHLFKFFPSPAYNPLDCIAVNACYANDRVRGVMQLYQRTDLFSLTGRFQSSSPGDTVTVDVTVVLSNTTNQLTYTHAQYLFSTTREESPKPQPTGANEPPKPSEVPLTPAPSNEMDCIVCGGTNYEITIPDARVVLNGVETSCALVAAYGAEGRTPPGASCVETIQVAFQSCGCAESSPVEPPGKDSPTSPVVGTNPSLRPNVSTPTSSRRPTQHPVARRPNGASRQPARISVPETKRPVPTFIFEAPDAEEVDLTGTTSPDISPSYDGADSPNKDPVQGPGGSDTTSSPIGDNSNGTTNVVITPSPTTSLAPQISPWSVQPSPSNKSVTSSDTSLAPSIVQLNETLPRPSPMQSISPMLPNNPTLKPLTLSLPPTPFTRPANESLLPSTKMANNETVAPSIDVPRNESTTHAPAIPLLAPALSDSVGSGTMDQVPSTGSTLPTATLGTTAMPNTGDNRPSLSPMALRSDSSSDSGFAIGMAVGGGTVGLILVAVLVAWRRQAQRSQGVAPMLVQGSNSDTNPSPAVHVVDIVDENDSGSRQRRHWIDWNSDHGAARSDTFYKRCVFASSQDARDPSATATADDASSSTTADVPIVKAQPLSLTSSDLAYLVSDLTPVGETHAGPEHNASP